ncbi:hypothetical protein CAPTEDRAFT_211325 [Capitella teleta]|uniref:Fibrinogen C-terminal domain-containing protein n=1 Tax=Capitella teleta TaxID=283909 RepID=R7UDW4_CAPTE|nr:hypothetical protein CAPTEDRAFT_211325 [Capitella teleta]|eukprot:ELU01958.1 hypothetical protein CAPTEDRAFT_211325 [Capitella teleta]
MKDEINDLEISLKVGVSCKELRSKGYSISGVYTIRSPETGEMKAYCDMETDGGGWLVFQRRKDGSQDFYLTWDEYAKGFGDLNNEFWLGNRKLHTLTAQKPHEVWIDLKDDNDTRFARYSKFKVGPESDNFRLAIGGYSGDAGDSMTYHNKFKFSTKDEDHDNWRRVDCAKTHKGGWWYASCHRSNRNGLYFNGTYTDSPRGLEWNGWSDNAVSLKFTEMKIRPLE